MQLEDVVNGAVGPHEDYCDGFNNSGASGRGYISVLKIATSKVKQTTDPVLDLVVSHDRAGATHAYTGQINMITATSFNGVNGAVWGYHLAKAELIASGSLKPLMFAKDAGHSRIPVYPIEPLLDAGERLLGTNENRRFILLPGAIVPCGKQAATASGYDSNNVGSSMTLAIAENREKECNLYLEDHGSGLPVANQQEAAKFLPKLIESIVRAALLCGENQSVRYKEIFIGCKVEFLEPGQVGCAMTCSPYLVLARNAVPASGAASILSMTISEWELAIGLGQS